MGSSEDESEVFVYRPWYGVPEEKDELDKIDFGLGLDHIHYQHYQELKKAQGDFKVGRPVGTPFPNVRAPKRHWKSYA